MIRNLIFILILASCVDPSEIEETKKSSNELMKIILDGSALSMFSEKYFDKEKMINIQNMLKDCNYHYENGKYINHFYHKNMSNADQVSHIYEYKTTCDSMRFILTYFVEEEPELMSFKIESVKNYNPMIIK